MNWQNGKSEHAAMRPLVLPITAVGGFSRRLGGTAIVKFDATSYNWLLAVLPFRPEFLESNDVRFCCP